MNGREREKKIVQLHVQIQFHSISMLNQDSVVHASLYEYIANQEPKDKESELIIQMERHFCRILRR